MENVCRTSKSHFFTTMLLLSPVVGLYSISTTVLNLADLVVFLALLFVLTRSIIENKIRICNELLPYYLYIILHLLFSLILCRFNDHVDFLGSTMRYLLILTSLIFFVKQYFDVEYGLKIYKYICIFSTVFLIIQTVVCVFFNYYIQGFLEISFLPIHREDLYDFGEDLSVYEIFRPRSIFSEPAAYAGFVIGYLAISLFKIGKKELPVQLFLSLGLLLSMSSTGILLMIGTWIMFFAIKFSLVVSRRYILTMLCIPFVLFMILQSEFFQNFLYRFLYTRSTQDRFQGYEWIMQYFKEKPFLFLIGVGNGGIQYDDIFLADYGRLIFYYGLVGVVIFAFSMVLLYLKSEKWQKMVLIVLGVLQTGGGSFFSYLILCQLPFIIVHH